MGFLAGQKKQKKAKNGVEYVYLIEGVDGWWKIGKTTDIKSRTKTFNVKLPFEITFKRVIECKNCSRLEAYLHARYNSTRKQGTEWFALTPRQLDDFMKFDATGW